MILYSDTLPASSDNNIIFVFSSVMNSPDLILTPFNVALASSSLNVNLTFLDDVVLLFGKSCPSTIIEPCGAVLSIVTI